MGLRRYLALALLCAAQFMVVLDFSIVNVALPAIQEELGFSRKGLQWVITGYVLAFGGFLLLGGRMADLYGRRRLFVAGLMLFALASAAGGFANSAGVLVGARAVQGLGAALISPAALSILTTTFVGEERNRALGVWGGVAAGGFSAGVILGGILTQSLGWEWVMFVNAPIGIAAAFLVSFGIVLPLTAASVAATAGLEDSKQGLASGLFSTTQQVGAALGLAILVAVSAARTEVLAGAGVFETEALASGLRYAFAGGAGFALAGALISFFLLREGKRKNEPHDHKSS